MDVMLYDSIALNGQSRARLKKLLTHCQPPAGLRDTSSWSFHGPLLSLGYQDGPICRTMLRLTPERPEPSASHLWCAGALSGVTSHELLRQLCAVIRDAVFRS